VRDSADSYDPAFGRIRKTNNKRQRNRLDDEETFAKRDRHVKRLATAETAADATDGLADGERWSTWDQTENPYPNDVRRIYSLPISCSTRGPGGIL
jgi:hypothetical protein